MNLMQLNHHRIEWGPSEKKDCYLSRANYPLRGTSILFLMSHTSEEEAKELKLLGPGQVWPMSVKSLRVRLEWLSANDSNLQ